MGLQPMPFAVLQSAFDGLLPTGLQWYWKADIFEEITDDAIAVHRRYGESIPTPLSTMHLYPISGAAARVPEDATAFAFRGGGWNGVIGGIDPDPANLATITDWARRYWEELHPSSVGGGYVNMMMDEGQERVRAAYRGNYARLVELKRRYDPHNLFRINQNIDRATARTAADGAADAGSRASGCSSSVPAWPAWRPPEPCTGPAPPCGWSNGPRRRRARARGSTCPATPYARCDSSASRPTSPSGLTGSNDSASPTTGRACCSRSASTRSGRVSAPAWPCLAQTCTTRCWPEPATCRSPGETPRSR